MTNGILMRGPIVILALALFNAPWAAAQLSGPFDISNSAQSNKFCGLYSMYAYLRLQDRNVTFDELVVPRYLGSPEGSSLEDLDRMADDFNIHAIPVSNMSLSALDALDTPAILHVWRYQNGNRWGHFVLLAGRTEDGLLVLNPPNHLEVIALDSIAPVWTGHALLLSETPIEKASLWVGLSWPVIRLLLLCALILIILRTISNLGPPLRERTPRLIARRCVWEATQLAMIGAVVAFIASVTMTGGLLRGTNSSNLVKDQKFKTFLKTVNRDSLPEVIAQGGIPIDARLRNDYEAGSIEGALNIPPTSSLETIQDIVANVRLDRQLIVYCQSSSCPYAVMVARKLHALGYKNLAYYKGGWTDWVAS